MVLGTDGSATLDRKSLKRPDRFVQWARGLFEKFASHSKQWVFLLGGLLLLVIGGGIYLEYRSTKLNEGRDAIFRAQRAYEKELKVIVEQEAALAQAAAAASKKPSKKGDKKEDKSELIDQEMIAQSVKFKSLDIEKTFPETFKLLKEVLGKYGSSAVTFRAEIFLGRIFQNHGHPDQAKTYYTNAVNHAPSSLEKVAALYALGITFEDSKDNSNAVEQFQKALSYGEASLKGEILLGIARNYELMNQSAKAAEFYDRIASELPDSEYARRAQRLKMLLKKDSSAS